MARPAAPDRSLRAALAEPAGYHECAAALSRPSASVGASIEESAMPPDWKSRSLRGLLSPIVTALNAVQRARQRPPHERLLRVYFQVKERDRWAVPGLTLISMRRLFFANGLHSATSVVPRAPALIYSSTAPLKSAYESSWPSRRHCATCTKYILRHSRR